EDELAEPSRLLEIRHVRCEHLDVSRPRDRLVERPDHRGRGRDVAGAGYAGRRDGDAADRLRHVVPRDRPPDVGEPCSVDAFKPLPGVADRLRLWAGERLRGEPAFKGRADEVLSALLLREAGTVEHRLAVRPRRGAPEDEGA